jgi:type I restriction enzyme S subunit
MCCSGDFGQPWGVSVPEACTDSWPTARLGAVCRKIGSGATPRGGKAVYQESGVVFIRSQNILDHQFEWQGLARISDAAATALRGVQVQRGDVLINITGDSVARCCPAPANLDARVSQHVSILRPDDRSLHPAFLAGYLASPAAKARLLQLASAGATRSALTKSHLEGFEIPVPPMAVQAAVAAVLESISGSLAANTRLTDRVVALAGGLLQQSMSGSPRRTVESVAHVRKGLSYTSAGLVETGMPMVNLANAENLGWLKRSGFKHYTGPYKPRHVAPPGALLISGVEQTWRHEIIGWPMLLPDDVGEALFSQDVFLVDFAPEHAWLKLPLWAHLYTPEARARIEGMIYGTTVARFPAEALTGLEFPAPPKDSPVLQAAEDLIRRAWLAERESAALAALRDALLPPLMSGELRVRGEDLDIDSLAEQLVH